MGETWTCQFNPFNPAVNTLSIGFVYEPLIYVSMLQNQGETPMLATSYTWGPGKRSITFDIRQGVRWSDGQPSTANDVAYTFQIMKRVPATDLYGLWTNDGLQSVTANGDKVTMRFDQLAQPYWTFNERLKYAFSRPVQFAPGTNWSYAHTNFMLLGQILSEIGHQPLDALLPEKVLGPMA